jgi:hypothetical protein
MCEMGTLTDQVHWQMAVGIGLDVSRTIQYSWEGREWDGYIGGSGHWRKILKGDLSEN